jgi:hypothetical protein
MKKKLFKMLAVAASIMLFTQIFTLGFQAAAATYTITVSVAAGSENMKRAEFYTTGVATVQSTSLTSGSDPALYNSAGSRIADDEAGSSHWRYTTVSGTHYFAGTYGNGAATYTITSNAPITRVRNGYNWPSSLGEYEGYYRIKHVYSGKYLTVESSGANQYGLTLSSSSTSTYQRWMLKTSNVANKTYNIINGGYTTRYLTGDASSPIYTGNHIDGHKAKTLPTTISCAIAKLSDSTNVYIRSSNASWALELDYYTDTTPNFYENSFGGWELGEWALELIYIKGDVNMDGQVTQADADLVLKASAKLVTLTALQTFLADMDNNGAIQSADSRAIQLML